jgi:oligoendopeptidase F
LKREEENINNIAASAGPLPRWDTSVLYRDATDRKIQDDLKLALDAALSFAQRYSGRVGELKAAALAAAIEEWEKIEELVAKAVSFAELTFASDTLCQEYLALVEDTRARATEVRSALLSFELEWVGLDDSTAGQILVDSAIAPRAHFLSRLRCHARHRLSLSEERILERTATNSHRTLSNLRDILMAECRFPLKLDGNHEELALEPVTALLHSPLKKTRLAAAEAITEGLSENSHLLAAIFSATLKNKAICDELRGYGDPAAERHLTNEVDAAIVEMLLGSCERSYGLVSRYYRLKARLLGLPRLDYYDRLAPVQTTQSTVDFDEARRIVINAIGEMSTQLGAVASMHFEDRWLDAQLRPGKRDGAFTMATVPQAHPYVSVNYTGKCQDVLVLAHELGHGIHLYMARRKGFFAQDVPVVLAESASLFTETLVLRWLINAEHDPRARLSLLCEKIEQSLNNVFRQVALTRFEQRVHAAFQLEGGLTFEQLSELWMDTQRAMFGDSVKLTDGYKSWWLLVPHLVHVPFYCYGYAFGELLALSLLGISQEADFPSRYLSLLSAGGSEATMTLLSRLGFDISKPGFWEAGLNIIEDLIDTAERLSSSPPA